MKRESIIYPTLELLAGRKNGILQNRVCAQVFWGAP